KLFAFPPESAFTFRPECCSESQRNGVRLQTGIAFTFDRIPQADAIVLKMSNIEHFPASERCIVQFMKVKELTPKQILSVPCTTCGAAIGEACELHTGDLRTEPHRDRKLSAADAVEKRPGKR
ncbi:MAG: hypothetical protein WCF26_19390, partial [Candidatus Sulfotelmatobacter sp.]